MDSIEAPFQKYYKPLIIVALIVLFTWLAVISSPVLIPFVVGILIAYLLMPMVHWFEKIIPLKGDKQKAKRIISVTVIFILLFIVVILFVTYVGAMIVGASGEFMSKIPQFISLGVDNMGSWVDNFKLIAPSGFEGKIDSYLERFGQFVGNFLQDFITGSVAMVPSSMPTITGFFILPFFIFFVLMDYEIFRKFFHDYMPERIASRANDILTILGNVMGHYVRSMIMLSAILGVIVFIGFTVTGIQYAPFLSLIIAITQFIPIVGPFVSGLIVIFITLALNSDKVLLALFVIVLGQVLLNTVFLNWILGKYMQIHPAVVMVLLVVGGYIASFWGMILALPVAATAWEIFKYLRAELQVDQPMP